MKNIIAAAILVLSVSTAFAGDLSNKKATPTPPARPAVEAPASWYVGVNAGGNVKMDQNVQNTPAIVGGVVGYKINPMFAVEATVDHEFKKNGVSAQRGHSANMIYNIDAIIVEISKFFTLNKGDLLYTGTPSGVAPISIGDRYEGILEGKSVFHLDIR
jgi:hypothetical protein